MKLYERVARMVASEWNSNGQCAGRRRHLPGRGRPRAELTGDMPLLVPGIGAQGGDIEATVTAGQHLRRHRPDDQFLARHPLRRQGRGLRRRRRAAAMDTRNAINLFR